jgi:hypothetical protein
MSEITQRVTLRPDGIYIWSAAVDMEEERRGYKAGGRIWELFALFLFPGGVIYSVRINSWKPFLWVAAFSVVILLITLGVVHGLESWPGEHRRTYRMSDTYLATGSGRRTALFEFKKAKTMILGKDSIELRARIGAFRVFIPEADYDFVRRYITSRVPGDCEIRYEQRK